MKVYSHQPNPAAKEQRPFIDSANKKASDKPAAFFGPSSIHKKEEPGPKPAEEEKKNDMQNQNKELEKDKDKVKQKQIQRKSEEEQKDPKAQEQKKEEPEAVKKKSIRRKRIGEVAQAIRKQGQEGAREASAELEQKLQNSKGKGFALPDDLRKELNGEMNYDFSHVRIHTYAEAIEMAQELDALAFTHGNDIYFNRNQYAPETPAGKELLVHELTHVIQNE